VQVKTGKMVDVPEIALYHICMIPYWMVAVPLTLLSAYLLLWPGKRSERKAKAPVEDN